MLDIEAVLRMMPAKNASDLYLTADAPALFRINGENQPVSEEPLSCDDTLQIACWFMSANQAEVFTEKQEMNLAYSISGVGRYRVNIFVQRGAVGLVIRLVKINIPSLDSLGIPAVMKDLVMLKRGLVLITGPTGTGKSTTLASMIDHRNQEQSGHILTVEDPIEFVHPHKKSIVTQREIGMDTHTYKAALMNALRQAPDVILIGEIRDAETMEAAIGFTETGHLVLGTLHTANANQTLDRIINFFPRDMHPLLYMQLSLNLAGICCQRLIPTANGKRRVPAVEILLATPRIRDLIHKGEVGELKQSMEDSVQEGCQTFDQSLYTHFKAGTITLEEALKNAESANNLRIKIKMEDPKALGGTNEQPRLTLHRR
jgi:twitching motility protein PilU